MKNNNIKVKITYGNKAFVDCLFNAIKSKSDRIAS